MLADRMKPADILPVITAGLTCIFPHHGAHILSVLQNMIVRAVNGENHRRYAHIRRYPHGSRSVPQRSIVCIIRYQPEYILCAELLITTPILWAPSSRPIV